MTPKSGKKYSIELIAIFILMVGIASSSWSVAETVEEYLLQGGSVLKVYKSPTCGCCGDWVEHMESAGFKVETYEQRNLAPVKIDAGVPPDKSSCHTALIGGYVIEGHVPAEQVKRLLKERPAVKGLTVPGMPIGSPGMEMGNRKDAYQVLSFDNKGKTSVFAEISGN